MAVLHNGLTSGWQPVFNQSDSVLIVVDNSYTARPEARTFFLPRRRIDPDDAAIDRRGGARCGVKWVRTITRTYDVAAMRDTLKNADTKEKVRR